MTGKTAEDWRVLLSRMNWSVLASEEWRSRPDPEALAAGWCGMPPATEEEDATAEMRLGLALPPSYRAFLSVSNGWELFGGFVQILLPVQEIDWFRNFADWLPGNTRHRSFYEFAQEHLSFYSRSRGGGPRSGRRIPAAAL